MKTERHTFGDDAQPWRRLLLLALGWLCVGVGLVGAVLPLLPTTPFMILALLCFAKSSERLHTWLYTHKIFGPSLQRWDQHRVIPPAAKAMSVTFMSASLIYAGAFTQMPGYALTAFAATVIFGAWYVLTKPSRAPEDELS